MLTFRFRAAAALELRRKQETAAAIARSIAESALSEARALADQAEHDRQAAQTAQLERQQQGADGASIDWHRNWITRLSARVDQARTEIETRAAAVRDADQTWRDARRRRLALERMRERAWRRFQQEQQRQELKLINELATLRHGTPDVWRDES
jgi:flagellar export protein FliJ